MPIGERIGQAYVRVIIQGDDTGKVGKAFDKELARVEKEGGASGRRTGHQFSREFEKELLNGTRRSIRRFADRMGDAFGRRSRNDFLHFVGTLARGATNLLGNAAVGAFRLGRAMFDAFKAIPQVISTIGTGLKLLFSGQASFGEIFGPLAASGKAALAPLMKSLGGVAVAIVGVIAVAAPLVTLFISLAGAATALALTLGGALLAALGPLAGILTPIGLGIGFLIAQFATMTSATKKAFKEGLDPLYQSLLRLTKIAQAEILKNFGTQMQTLTDGLKNAGVDNLFKVIGQSISGFLGDISNATKSGVFQRFIQDLTVFIPELSKSLTTTFINLGAGLAGVFRASIPVTREFLGWLERITGEFSAFANSVKGQERLKTFFAETAKSAKAVGGLIKDITVTFFELFKAGGNEAGIRLIDSMRAKLQQFIAFIRANPASVREFFIGAVEVAEAVGRALLSVIQLLGSLNTEASRSTLIAFLSVAAGLADSLAAAINGVSDALAASGGFLNSIIPGFQGLVNRINEAGGAGKKAQKDIAGPYKPIVDTSPLLRATETLQLTEEEAKAMGLELSKERRMGNIDASPLDTARDKMEKVITSAFNMNQALNVAGGAFGIFKTFSDISKGVSGLLGSGTTVSVKPQADPVALTSLTGQINAAVSAARPVVSPKTDPAAISAIKSSLATGLGPVNIQINAGGNAQGVISRTKTALAGLIASPKSITITAGGNAQGVISRTRAALTTLIRTRAALNITAGGNAQAVIARTKARLVDLMRTPSKINISAGGNAQGVIARTKAALEDLMSMSPVEIEVKVTTTGAKVGGIVGSIKSKYMAEGGIIQSMASGGFANFRQYINPYTIAGEAGREAIVPLQRPLSLVDPAVRLLSAVAQGQVPVGGPSTVIDNSGWTIMSNAKDPEAVARRTLAHITSNAY